MSALMKTILPEIQNELRKSIAGEVRFDTTSRILYSTDASIYQVEPLGVVFPRTLDELQAVVEVAAKHQVPILPRGSGSSLAGQAIGEALIIDCSRYLNRDIHIDPEERSVVCEPGVVLEQLNKEAGKHGLQFGPDPASAERATMGGSIANNATGAHSILYGMVADNILSVDVILSDGSTATFEEIELADASRRTGYGKERDDLPIDEKVYNSMTMREAAIYAAALDIREKYAEEIRKRWSKTWRRASGYNLNYLIPWTYSRPPQWSHIEGQKFLPYPPIPDESINLAALIAGSEGTLAVIRRAKLRLVPLPKFTILGVLSYANLADACDDVHSLLEFEPSAIELIPNNLIRLARSVPAYARSLAFVDDLSRRHRKASANQAQQPEALLVVEFTGDDQKLLREKIRRLSTDALIAESQADQNKIWSVRKVGLGILLSQPGDVKPIAFIEDLSVPVENLGTYVREMERILTSYRTQGDFYAHASAGCLHMRPLLNLKTTEGLRNLRAIAEEAVALVLRLGGAVSGEHGIGQARSEWLDRINGPELMNAYTQLKRAADPHGILNPGKMTDATRMDQNLRFSPSYQTRVWRTALDFSSQQGLAGAVEQCNGAGVCRKSDGVMCPSFQATAEEMHSTRGRANLLRAMISRDFSYKEAEVAVYEAMDLCLACKGCRAECPSKVDMAKLKYEFLHYFYGKNATGKHRRRWRDYLFGFIGSLASAGVYFAPVVNGFFQTSIAKSAGEVLLGISKRRSLPQLSRRSLQQQIPRGSKGRTHDFDCLFLSDPFTEYFYPEVGIAAVNVLEATGCNVYILPIVGSGRTLLSKGFVPAARKQATKVVTMIKHWDPEGRLPVVGVEPSEILTLRDEYLDLIPGDGYVKQLATRAFCIDEFLVRPGENGAKRIMRIAKSTNQAPVLLHNHCYQQSQPPAPDGYASGASATVEMLETVGYEVRNINSGCCGMAGAFGYEAEHYDLSMKIGELKLFPAIRKAVRDSDRRIIATAGVSCRSQIVDGTGQPALHPITLLNRA